MITILALSLLMHSMTYATNTNSLQELLGKNPFSYNLGIKIIPTKTSNNEVTICCHGYGHNNQIVDVVKSYNVVPGNLIGFNFPDYNITPDRDHHKVAYGTINEILPLLYILNRCVVDLKIPKINVYGFSAGGGAVINTLAILNQTTYDKELEKIGITADNKKQILKALEQGSIILDCPLKSCEEIIQYGAKIPHFDILVRAYINNNMTPLTSVSLLNGLKLTIFLHFEKPDEILGNRDDALFIERLRAANRGTTTVTQGSRTGHNGYHAPLWDAYKQSISKN